MPLSQRVHVYVDALPFECARVRAAAFAYMHKEFQIESPGVFIRLSVELLMEFMAPLVTLEKCWRRLEETENKQDAERGERGDG